MFPVGVYKVIYAYAAYATMFIGCWYVQSEQMWKLKSNGTLVNGHSGMCASVEYVKGKKSLGNSYLMQNDLIISASYLVVFSLFSPLQ